MLSANERRLRARIAAFSMHAQGRTNTSPGRDAFLQRFVDQVDPEHRLPDEVRRQRAQQARKAYFAQLALKSSRARAADRVKKMTAPAPELAGAVYAEAHPLDENDRSPSPAPVAMEASTSGRHLRAL